METSLHDQNGDRVSADSTTNPDQDHASSTGGKMEPPPDVTGVEMPVPGADADD